MTPSGPVERDGAVELVVYVQPRARRTEICGLHDGMVKVKVAAPPVDNAANDAVVDFFASHLHLPKSSVRIVAGHTSRRKRVRIEHVSLTQITPLLPYRG
jgi:uncharacterized protein (TIGR00251 family)